MVMPNLIELINQLGRVPQQPLLDALRRIHEGGGGDLSSVLGLLESDGDTANGRPAPKREPVMVASAPPRAKHSADPDYESLRRQVVRREKTQRREAMLVDQLLEHWMRDKGSRRGPLQQEIRVQCEAGSNSGARFVLVNSLGRSADIDFNVGHVHELSLERQDAVSIRFDPERARLGANEERLVSMTVQVRDVEGLPDALECGVDVRGGGQNILKLWVRIEVRSTPSLDGR